MKIPLTLIVSAITIVAIVGLPLIAAAQANGNGTTVTGIGSLVPCGNGNGNQIATPYDQSVGGNQSTSGCNFYALVTLVKNITDFLIILSAPIFVGIMIWAGVMLLLKPANTENWKKIRTVLWNTLLAFLIILAGWLIVHVIASTLFNPAFDIFNI